MDNKITIIDEYGEHEYTIVLTFDDGHDTNYVLVTDPDDPEGNVYPFRYDDAGNLDAVEDEEGLEMCAEVLAAFTEEEEDE